MTIAHCFEIVSYVLYLPECLVERFLPFAKSDCPQPSYNASRLLIASDTDGLVLRNRPWNQWVSWIQDIWMGSVSFAALAHDVEVEQRGARTDLACDPEDSMALGSD